MANPVVFEKDVADLCDQTLALQAQIERLSVQRWRADTGAGYEPIWNATPDTPAFKPTGASVNQSEMNNAISAINSVKAAIAAASAALAVLAEYSPSISSNV